MPRSKDGDVECSVRSDQYVSMDCASPLERSCSTHAEMAERRTFGKLVEPPTEDVVEGGKAVDPD